ncbi:hypothetical protein [Vescimonas sanitatis]|uniref:hypothetical protein n=1 Tax=Vescimonas sanitatis TaxID=3376993 RepID=UPI003A1DCB7D
MKKKKSKPPFGAWIFILSGTIQTAFDRPGHCPVAFHQKVFSENPPFPPIKAPFYKVFSSQQGLFTI